MATLTAEVEDLQDALGICETEKQRIEVKYQAARTGWDHQQRMRESEEDTGSRQLQQKVSSVNIFLLIFPFSFEQSKSS